MSTTSPAFETIMYDSQDFTSNSNTTLKSFDTLSPIVDAVTYWYLQLVAFSIFGIALSLFGVATNAINIIVFIKMGFKDAINVSLLGLSISDLLSCLTMFWVCLTCTPGFMDMELPFKSVETGYATGTWPHFISVKITSCITMFITFERCMCVIFPLKVKRFITPKKVFAATVGIYIFVLAMVSPMFHVNRLAYRPNSTVVSLIYTDRDKIEPIVIMSCGTVLPTVVFFATILFTIILVQTLKKNAAWRDKVAQSGSGGSSSGASSRDVKIARMVVFISLIFIICFSPVMLVSISSLAIPDIRMGAAYARLTIVLFSFISLLELTNASLNIFIYYYRSSNYRTVFDKLFKKAERVE